MSDKIVKLVTKSETELDAERADTVRILEKYLERAKRGELVTVAIAASCGDGSTWTGHSYINCFAHIVGAVRRLETILLNVWDEAPPIDEMTD